jgi:hypothetical protein
MHRHKNHCHHRAVCCAPTWSMFPARVCLSKLNNNKPIQSFTTTLPYWVFQSPKNHLIIVIL